MKKQSDRYIPDKKKLLREQDRLTRPPRLEGGVKEGMMQPVRKQKASTIAKQESQHVMI